MNRSSTYTGRGPTVAAIRRDAIARARGLSAPGAVLTVDRISQIGDTPPELAGEGAVTATVVVRVRCGEATP